MLQAFASRAMERSKARAQGPECRGSAEPGKRKKAKKRERGSRLSILKQPYRRICGLSTQQLAGFTRRREDFFFTSLHCPSFPSPFISVHAPSFLSVHSFHCAAITCVSRINGMMPAVLGMLSGTGQTSSKIRPDKICKSFAPCYAWRSAQGPSMVGTINLPSNPETDDTQILVNSNVTVEILRQHPELRALRSRRLRSSSSLLSPLIRKASPNFQIIGIPLIPQQTALPTQVGAQGLTLLEVRCSGSWQICGAV